MSLHNLGSHLAKLENAGFVAIDKAFQGKPPRTSIRLTGQGRDAVEQHWRRLKDLERAAATWQPPAG